MYDPQSLATQRLFGVLAWFVFVFCSVFIVTGFIVGSTSPSSAEEGAVEQEEFDDDGVPVDDEPDVEQMAEEIAEGVTRSVTGDDKQPSDDADPDVDPDVDADGVPQTDSTEVDDPGDDEQEDTADAEDEQPQTVALGDMEGDTPFWQRLISFLGILALLFVAWLMSNNRRRVNWQLVAVGVGLQLTFGVFIFFVPGGEFIFAVATEAVTKLLEFTDDGSAFIFESFVTQEWEPGLINFAFAVLPTIIFFSSLMTILYHLGVMQKLVHFFALVMQKTMNLSGAESTSAAANIFVGQTEAPLVIKPFVEDMTQSELMVVMTGGFATVAGGVLAIYVGMLDATFPDIAGHLIAASVMSAPAALVVAKIMYPETSTPETMGKLEVQDIKQDVNVLGAASRGAGEGLKLALNVGAMLLAFIALIAMANYLIGLPSLLYNKFQLSGLADVYISLGLAIPDGCHPDAVADDMVKECVTNMQQTSTVMAAAVEALVADATATEAAVTAGHAAVAAGAAASEFAASGQADIWLAPMITMQDIFGWVFWPFAFLMGVPVEDCFTIGRLLGEKMVINELVAYASLQQLLLDPEVILQERSVIIATYALCGFANFGSIGIQLGGIGGIAPSRKQDLAKIALRAMIGGTLAAFMTATVAGILV